MSTVKLNPAFEGFSGQIGDLVFKTYQDQVVVARKGESSKPPTAAQLAVRERFRLAVQYGKLAMADATVKAIYEAVADSRRVRIFSLMVADYFHAPVIDALHLDGFQGQSGDTMAIDADDDVQVAGVTVTIAQTDGTVLAEGEAVETPPNGGRWVFTVTADLGAAPGTDVLITAVVRDLPGNETTRTDEFTL